MLNNEHADSSPVGALIDDIVHLLKEKLDKEEETVEEVETVTLDRYDVLRITRKIGEEIIELMENNLTNEVVMLLEDLVLIEEVIDEMREARDDSRDF